MLRASQHKGYRGGNWILEEHRGLPAPSGLFKQTEECGGGKNLG